MPLPSLLRRRLAGLGRRLARLDPASSSGESTGAGEATAAVNARYVEAAPSAANAVELFAGRWSTRLPIDTPTGPVDLVGDHRVVSCVDALGGVADADVLELGPLEGAHTITLRELGARRVVAIEANTDAYLRCLVTKEVTGLDGAEFRLGDFRPYLADTTDRYDLAVAIGVLYHLDDPAPVLADLARITDRIVIWTHVFVPGPGGEPSARRFAPPVTRSLGDVTYRLHPFRYLESLELEGFCGGTRPTASWIERDDLLAVVDALGFEVVHRDDQDHEFGPAVTLALQRR